MHLTHRVSPVLLDFTRWLEAYGETSWDHQSFFAGPSGRLAKSLYYRNRLIGTAAVAPMIFLEAFVPGGRRLFHHPIRFPIADAHYAMGFAFLYEATSEAKYLERAIHFLHELKKSRSPDFEEYCWGYPFDWVWRGGIIEKQTPLITTTPYCYEAFLQVAELLGRRSEIRDQRSEGRGQMTHDGFERTDFGRPSGPSALNHQPSTFDNPKDLLKIVESIARHAAYDIKAFRTSVTASSCSYTPFDEGGVINAAAYRAFLLTSTSQNLSNDDY